ncbi:MAG: sulfite exporter TauE/SafE family protein [Verrucomicrobia bacterium]|nr:sulfite exporter TauE/SafE family protein [Verrucomicrobiota bacterium]
MELWTAFLLGLVGSAHCAGMCGPLALALPATGNTRAAFLAGRLLYNLGRILTYAALGAIFGLIGQGFALAGLQRWVSLVAGATILISLVASARFGLGIPATSAVGWLKSGFGKLLQQRSLASVFALGLLNGLLPCGLVYVAAAGATASGHFLLGLESMVAFGLGTVPMMLAFGLVGPKLQFALRFKLQRLIPASLAVVGTLLILRGLALGIPYLSPDLSAGKAACPACHADGTLARH